MQNHRLLSLYAIPCVLEIECIDIPLQISYVQRCLFEKLKNITLCNNYCVLFSDRCFSSCNTQKDTECCFEYSQKRMGYARMEALIKKFTEVFLFYCCHLPLYETAVYACDFKFLCVKGSIVIHIPLICTWLATNICISLESLARVRSPNFNE